MRKLRSRKSTSSKTTEKAEVATTSANKSTPAPTKAGKVARSSSKEVISSSNEEDYEEIPLFGLSELDMSDVQNEILLEDLKESEKVAREKHHYTNLTDYMLRVDRIDRNRKSEKPTTTIPLSHDEANILNNAGFTLSLEQRLPLLQVLDAIGDINKVLKNGEITPRMERVLEYKQDHPFQYGYEEDELGCCSWLVYKLENMFKRFHDSQWPYNYRN